MDVWSLGCILYTLLIGKPPFETSCLKDTYAKIKKNEYSIPPNKVSIQAKNLINHLLQADPQLRPTMCHILQDEFFFCGYMPPRLPTTCLSMPPRFDRDSMQCSQQATATSSLGTSASSNALNNRKPLLELNNDKAGVGSGGTVDTVGSANVLTGRANGPLSSAISQGQRRGDVLNINGQLAQAQQDNIDRLNNDDIPEDYYLQDLYQQLTTVILAKPTELENLKIDDAEDPACVPMLWVSKWVDYSDKYGLGYQLCDDSVGVLFNDSTRLILCSSGENLQYIERDGNEFLYTLNSYPDWLQKKITLLKYFRDYMTQHLLKAGATIAPRPGDEMSRLPFLRTWLRTRNAIILHLSNGTLQINFFHDHTKIIVCPIMGAVTYIDEKRDYRTFKLSLIEKYGCNREIFTRLKYAKTIVERIMASKMNGRHKSS